MVTLAEKPCCAADALRRIRQIDVNGIPTGITMLDESISEVKELGLTDEGDVCEALMKQVKIYNYIPPGVQEAYTEAIMREYHANRKKR
ncbi:MAG: hypothetical protein MUF37_08050 [Methanoregulaceae archaeon]|nr:hypothetical protein [Methanoregulaceae archaeon]